MVGRIAQQRPWIFGQIDQYLSSGIEPEEPTDELKHAWLISHLKNLHAFYGEHQGVRIARKHINWQLGYKQNYYQVKTLLMQARTATEQLDTIEAYFNDCYLTSYDWAC